MLIRQEIFKELFPNDSYIFRNDSFTFVDKKKNTKENLSLLENTIKKEEYKYLRKYEYDKLNQDELRYNDFLNGTNTWVEAIQAIKEKYPKPE
jgi:hypothetical protein